MTLDRAGVERALASTFTRVPPADVRLVGTASSLLRGITTPAGDIDILFRDRADVDAWFVVLSADLDVEIPPAWIADTQQYFARVHSDGVAIELSTVEIDSDADTMECVGAGPWQYFDLVRCGDGTLPVVATELRLLTEVARFRENRYRPIVDHLRAEGCDIALIRRGLANIGATKEVVDRVLVDLSIVQRNWD
jgi:hypothetical protein